MPTFHDKKTLIRGNSRNLITPANYKNILFIRAVFSAKRVFSTRNPAGVESGFFYSVMAEMLHDLRNQFPGRFDESGINKFVRLMGLIN